MALRPTIRVSRFFDVNSLTSRIERSWARAMKRAGRLIMFEAMDTMKHIKKGVSAPGAFPHRHSKTKVSLRRIWYDYDPRTKTVVVGPAKFKNDDTSNLIEFGGTRVIKQRRGRVRKVRYRARPFMGPSLKKKRSDIAKEFRNTVTTSEVGT